MQEKRPRRSNAARTEATRTALVTAARALFVEKGFAETGTPEIVAKAQVTRGALYHHFADKTDLFRAVAQAELRSVADEIERTAKPAPPSTPSPMAALIEGMDGYFDAMADTARVSLLLLDGPAVLGPDEMRALSAQADEDSLRQGLAAALGADAQAPEMRALSEVLSAAFDRAAMAISAGSERDVYTAAMRLIIERLCEKPNSG